MEEYMITRMHSSGMRTARLLTISQHVLCSGVCVSQHALDWGCIPACTGQGVCIPACTGHGGVCPGVSAWGGVSAEGCVCVADTPLWHQRQTASSPVNRMTDICLWKYNLAATSLRAIINLSWNAGGRTLAGVKAATLPCAMNFSMF